MVLKDVRHVPKMCFSFISVGKLDDEGYHSHLGESKWKLTKGSLILVRGGEKQYSLQDRSETSQ